MAHFAELDENNIVLQVLVTNNDFENEGHDWLVMTFGGTWVKTSYNASIRKNFAGVGFFYDETRDAFIPPKPFGSWVLNEETCRWDPPTPYPEDGVIYAWNEEITDWQPVVFESEISELES
jgi:hypothetical protein